MARLDAIGAAINKNIVEKAKLALSIIVGANAMQDQSRALRGEAHSARQAIAMESRIRGQNAASGGGGGGAAAAAGDADPDEDPGKPAESFKQHIHDVFLRGFGHDMLECGVLIVDMSIEDIRINDRELASTMARGAVARTELVKAGIDAQVAGTQAVSEQNAEVTRAQGRARAIEILAAAEANRVRQLDEAMRSVSETTRQRELVRAAGEVVGQTKSTMFLSSSVNEAVQLLSAGIRQGGAPGGTE